MTVGAAQLFQIQTADLNQAIADYSSAVHVHDFAESTKFDLLVRGHERYPPKAIIGLAARNTFGRVLSPADFSGGESSPANRLLLDRGFEIVTKLRTVTPFDATFSVGRNRDHCFLIVESRGPKRNTDYNAGLEVLLRGLTDLDATLLGASLASEATRHLSEEQRRIGVPPYEFPLVLRGVSDINALRLRLTSAAAATGRRRGSGGGGNPTKRLRIDMTLPDDLRLYDIADTLAEMGVPPESPPQDFHFHPSGPSQNADSVVRRAIDTTVVTRVHIDLQKQLYDELVRRYGGASVAAEQITPSGRPADLVAEVGAEYEIYEIKTALSPRDCVRQALGQLLEYAYWPGSPAFRALWVVGPSAVDAYTREYLEILRKRFSLPIRYLQQPPTRG